MATTHVWRTEHKDRGRAERYFARHVLCGLAGIGAADTFLVGVLFFCDPSSLGRWLGAALILGGVITLKLAH